MRRTRILVIFSTVLALSLLLGSLFLADEDRGAENELVLAEQAALSRLAKFTSEGAMFPEFEGASLLSAQPYYDLKGDLICHMFGLGKDGEVLGTIVVGSCAYDNSVMEVFNAPPPCAPSLAEVKKSLENDLGIRVDEKSIDGTGRLLHLGPASDWALYNVNGQSVAIHLWTGRAAQASDLKFSMSTPEQMREYDEMRELESLEGNSGDVWEMLTHLPDGFVFS